MSDFYEIDFLTTESEKSADAITIRYQIDGKRTIHVVDGGFRETGEEIIFHINKYYEEPEYIDRVIISHPDNDHTGGLLEVLKSFKIGEIWMLRPWLYADELIDRFPRLTSISNLEDRLRDIYPSINEIEVLAKDKGIKVFEPFQGSRIGEFIVLAPSRHRYLELVAESEKTPESEIKKAPLSFKQHISSMVKLIRSIWGEENFSTEGTSSENEMSLVQYTEICGEKILLTGDAGRNSLTEAADYIQSLGIDLPGINCFQVPHHGSRRNLSSEILDKWLGNRLPSTSNSGEKTVNAIVSCSKEDKDHPKKAVIRALIHRGARVYTTANSTMQSYSPDAPDRGWSPAIPLEYPEEQEE